MDGSMLPVPIVIGVAAIIGAIIGSFLNVCHCPLAGRRVCGQATVALP